MVKIPTSRDVGYVSSRSGRIAPSGPTVSAGEGLRQLGAGIVQASYNLADLAQATQRDQQAKQGYDLETKLTRFRAEEEQRYLQAREEASESGIGFTRGYMENYQQRANEFIKQNFGAANEGQNQRGRQALLGLGNSLYSKANSYETQSKLAFYDRETNSGLDTIRTQIRNNAAPYDELKEQGLAQIEAADMPDAWKAERRAMWDADAQESQWRWDYEQNPQEAIAGLKPVQIDAPEIADGIVTTANALGIDPVDLATAISYETGGTFDPKQKGPTTQHGRHRGLIQFGEPQAAQHGVDWDNPVGSQLGENGAIASYLRAAGVKPGMGLLDIYSAINAGQVGRYNASDANNGGAPGTVRDKVEKQMAGHRAKAESLLAGKYVPTSRYEDIPYDRREKLASWGQTQYDQQQTQQRTQTADMYRLMIATEPENVSQDIILNDTVLDDGDKATLINALNTKNKESEAANAVLSSLAATGSANINAVDNDQAKAGDNAYNKLIGGAENDEQRQAITEDFVGRTKYVPKSVRNDIANGLNSTTNADVMASLQRSQRLAAVGQQSLMSVQGGKDILDAAKDFETMTLGLGYTPEQATRQYMEDRDRAKKAGYDTLVSEAKEIAKGINNADIQSVFGYGAISRGTGFAAEVGYTGAQNAEMLGEYKDFFISEYTRTGNADTAKARADDKMRRLYGTSSMFLEEDVITKFPPENYYPTVGGTYDYVSSQAANAIEEITGKKYPDSSVFLMADMKQTARDVQSIENGKPVMPRYQLWYVDENGLLNRAGELDDYFVPDVTLGQEMLKEQLRVDRATTKSQAEFTEQSTPAEAVGSQLDAVRGAAMVGAEDRAKQRAAESAKRKVDQEEATKAVEDAVFKNLNSSNRKFYQ